MLLLSLGLGRLLPHRAGHPSDEPLMKVPTGWNKGFPCGSAVMSLPAHEGDVGLMYGWEDPLEKEMATHSSILAWKSHGQRRLVIYTPRGWKELDTI